MNDEGRDDVLRSYDDADNNEPLFRPLILVDGATNINEWCEAYLSLWKEPLIARFGLALSKRALVRRRARS